MLFSDRASHGISGNDAISLENYAVFIVQSPTASTTYFHIHELIVLFLLIHCFCDGDRASPTSILALFMHKNETAGWDAAPPGGFETRFQDFSSTLLVRLNIAIVEMLSEPQA